MVPAAAAASGSRQTRLPAPARSAPTEARVRAAEAPVAAAGLRYTTRTRAGSRARGPGWNPGGRSRRSVSAGVDTGATASWTRLPLYHDGEAGQVNRDRVGVYAFLVIGMVSCSMLMYEILLTRVCALRLFFHFGFLVVSNCLLGIGASGSVIAAAKITGSPFRSPSPSSASARS